MKRVKKEKRENSNSCNITESLAADWAETLQKQLDLELDFEDEFQNNSKQMINLDKSADSESIVNERQQRLI